MLVFALVLVLVFALVLGLGLVLVLGLGLGLGLRLIFGLVLTLVTWFRIESNYTNRGVHSMKVAVRAIVRIRLRVMAALFCMRLCTIVESFGLS